MGASDKKIIVVRPFSSQKSAISLLICSLTGIFFCAIALFIYLIAPRGDSQANALILIMGIMSAVMIILGIILFTVFPRVTIIFDAVQKCAFIKKGFSAGKAVPFGSLQQFRIYEILRGYAHQYYCRNDSFGEYSDLFFSSSHGKTYKKARMLAALTGADLIDYDKNR